MDGVQGLPCWPIPWTLFTPHFSWLWAVFDLTGHSLFLGTNPAWPLVFSWPLLLIFLAAPPLLTVYILWHLGTKAGLPFLPLVSPGGVSSCSTVSPNKNQQSTHIYISFELWTYLTPLLGFITGLSYGTDRSAIWLLCQVFRLLSWWRQVTHVKILRWQNTRGYSRAKVQTQNQTKTG